VSLCGSGRTAAVSRTAGGGLSPHHEQQNAQGAGFPQGPGGSLVSDNPLNEVACLA
jgi:hypothetical protein